MLAVPVQSLQQGFTAVQAMTEDPNREKQSPVHLTHRQVTALSETSRQRALRIERRDN